MVRPAIFFAAVAFSALLPVLSDAAKCPNLQLVVDRSGSMNEPVGNSTRWKIARAAIQKLLDRYAGKVPVGLSLFPKGGESCGAEEPIPPGLSTRREIIKMIDEKDPIGSTPTHDAVNRSARLQALKDPARKQFLILITDGLPECDTDGNVNDQTAIAAIQQAREQTPPIYTFVVGFGQDPPGRLRDALRAMAEAGGRPAPTPEKFYPAEDEASLELALDEILKVVQGEFGGQICDESCVRNGCPAGEVCLRNECQRNPCGELDCGPGQYCYTDGMSPGSCRKACLMSCPAGQRCSMGACISDPCGNLCLPGTVCNTAARRCELDPACKPQVAPECIAPAECQGGRCVLDPCLYIRCPLGTDCVAWDGSCTVVERPEDPTEERHRGCAAGSSGRAPAASFALLLSVLLLPWVVRSARRRQKRRV